MRHQAPAPRPHRLLAAGWLLAAGTAVHLAVHLRRGSGSVSGTLLVVGTLSLVPEILAIVLIVGRHRWAALAAIATGFPLALGLVAVHWLPEWSSISDPVWQVEAHRSWSSIASLAEVLGAVAIGVAGLTHAGHDPRPRSVVSSSARRST